MLLEMIECSRFRDALGFVVGPSYDLQVFGRPLSSLFEDDPGLTDVPSDRCGKCLPTSLHWTGLLS